MTQEFPRRTFLATATLLSAGSTVSAAPVSGPSNVIDPRTFGARCDGESDDSSAVQQAIDRCLAQSPPATLALTGLASIAKPLTINRKVDAGVGRFRIIGHGGNAGLRAAKPMVMIVSTLGSSADPSSEFLSFEKVRFVGSRRGGAVALSSHFLRVHIVDCDFDGVGAGEGSTYLQEWTLERNMARYWRGSFLKARGAFALRSFANKFQHGDAVYDIVDPSGQYGCIGCSFDGDIVESCAGHYLAMEQTRAVSVRSLYFEGNAGAALVLNQKFAGSAANVEGCFFMPQDQNAEDPRLFAVRWGKTRNGTSRGNWSGSRLHLDGGGLISEGDAIDLVRSHDR